MDALLSTRRRLLAAAAGTLALAGCGERRPGASAPAVRPTLRIDGEAMGSTWVVKLPGVAAGADAQRRLRDAVHSALAGVDRRMSIHRDDSELSRFNRHGAAPFAMSAQMFGVFEAGRLVSEASGGAFDVSVAPLVDAWGFGAQRRSEVPPPSRVQARRGSVDWRGFVADAREGSVAKARGDMRADLGGIAKGHAVDLAAAALDALGVADYMVEAGGEVRTRGVNAEGLAWRIGIERPDALPQRAHLVVPMSGRAMATSGDYRNFFEQGGRRYSHAIDPVRAEPVDHGLASVTVVDADCMRADAWATALLVLGPQRGPQLAESLGLAAHFIARRRGGGFDERSTPAFAALGARHA
jgi:thiamine biosynthesis lipoprotein